MAGILSTVLAKKKTSKPRIEGALSGLCQRIPAQTVLGLAGLSMQRMEPWWSPVHDGKEVRMTLP